jgi:hypothetical protein
VISGRGEAATPNSGIAVAESGSVTMAPRELPIILGLELALGSCVWSRLVVARAVPRGWPSFEAGRLEVAVLGLALAGLFGLEARRRRRLLVSRGLLDVPPAPAATYRESPTTNERAQANEALFRERSVCAALCLLLCLAGSFVHRAPLAWNAWPALFATAGAMIFVRFRDGAGWALALPFLAGVAYAASGNPLVAVPQIVLFVICWIIARLQLRDDPSAGWATGSWER